MAKQVTIYLPNMNYPSLIEVDTFIKAEQRLKDMGYLVLDTSSDYVGVPLDVLNITDRAYVYSVAARNLSRSDTAYFCAGWENDYICKFAHRVVKECGIEVLYEIEEKKEDFQCTLEELIESDPGGKNDA